jgi:sulfate permease, SulP family
LAASLRPGASRRGPRGWHCRDGDDRAEGPRLCLSASSLNEASGARTPVASLTTGALVLATLVFLAPLFSDLPQAVLAAIIIDAVVFGMIDLAELRRLHRVTRFDFWIAGAAILAVLSAGVLAGVVIGVALSLGWLIYVATRPAIPVLGREPGTQVFRDLVASSPPQRRSRIASASFGMGPIHLCARSFSTDAEGISLRLARVKPTVRSVLQADGLIERIGNGHIHGNVHRAVEASSADRGGSSDGR